jgi:hypothetical protein
MLSTHDAVLILVAFSCGVAGLAMLARLAHGGIKYTVAKRRRKIDEENA